MLLSCFLRLNARQKIENKHACVDIGIPDGDEFSPE